MTKIGLLIPSVNTVAEGEFHAGTSAKVTVHTARMKVEGTSADYVRAMVADSLPRAISEIGLETFDFDQFIREREQAALSLAGS